MSDKYPECPNCGGPMRPIVKRTTPLMGESQLQPWSQCMVCGAEAPRSRKATEAETKRKVRR